MAEGQLDMKEYDEKLEKRLKDFGDLLRLQPSATEKGMRTIERMKPVKRLGSITFMPPLLKSGLGLAACLIIGAWLWLSTAGPITITLADVQKSIDLKTWVLIRYDDGAQRWSNLREQRSFYTCPEAENQNFYAGMRDHVNGIWRYYHTNWGRQIHEQPFTPRPYPQTPWEYAVGDWDDRGLQLAPQTVERLTDSIDGSQVVRFDTYSVGPLGLRALAQQVWADPETRLPVRIRIYSGPESENKFGTGDFSFPETGPSSIYDLGVPQGLKAVTNWGIIEPAAKVIVDAAKEAQRQFPRKLRIVEKNNYRVSISYRCGNKFRSESYGQTDANHNNLLPFDPPKSNEQLREWASNKLTLFELCIFDGEYEYVYDSDKGLRDSSEQAEATLNIRYHEDDWVSVLLPIKDQWPYTDNVGPMKVLEDEPGTPPGCVLLRFEREDLRRDWYVDPEWDYICVKQSEFRKDEESNQWIEQELIERKDFTRLPSGQWYAGTIKTPGRWTELTEIDVKLLADEDDSTSLFDGENLLRNVMDAGAKITFWAR